MKIKKHESGLFVSTCGRIFKEAKYGHRGNRKKSYKMVAFKGKRFDVHRLVAMTFLPLVDGKNWVLHADDDPSNNNLKNLRWGTPKENSDDAIKNGRFKLRTKKNGKLFRSSKDKSLIIERIFAGDKYRNIAEEFGYTEGRISQIAKSIKD